ncbi:hypothetical protein N473_18380 [Pseudoalteromonas luteoviolacea CPMOR-1]|uniref:Uncharacterized protein n=1 Tax=Pseudoalteromonas luteoviolacea CPMOR-1 TaxID=1365248 RepID=A0A167KJC3_9GAMM|nr:hypothetical protein N473_18380 [Pseudoalteromonas luteoviolacea CPMOR-1]
MSLPIETALLNAIVFRGLQISLVLALIYFVFTAKSQRVARIYDKRFELKTKQEQCFASFWITFFCLFIYILIDEQITNTIIAADLDYLLRRKLFYFFRICGVLMFLVSVYSLHSLRQCAFSPATRIAFYISIPVVSIFFLQLILRGYLEIEALVPLYRWLAIVQCSTLSVVVLSNPVSEIYQMYKKRDM